MAQVSESQTSHVQSLLHCEGRQENTIKIAVLHHCIAQTGTGELKEKEQASVYELRKRLGELGIDLCLAGHLHVATLDSNNPVVLTAGRLFGDGHPVTENEEYQPEVAILDLFVLPYVFEDATAWALGITTIQFNQQTNKCVLSEERSIVFSPNIQSSRYDNLHVRVGDVFARQRKVYANVLN